jgi:DNA-binding transcriptional LysR family regulator
MIWVVRRRRMPTICQSQLLLKRQHATPVGVNPAGSGRDFYTWLTSRLLPTYGGLFIWEFEKDSREVKVRVDGQITVNNIALRLASALDGLGLAYMPEDQVLQEIQARRPVRVLDNWCPPFAGYHLYYPRGRQHSAAFGLMLDALRYRSSGDAHMS